MRLDSIKLSGFKSFVDPTSVKLASDLTAIVGPNGSGKSNIIDGVRWVMGESSAKHLRGESIADVIFNGSTHRKPLGQASIELIFDNSSGKLGGQYASYATVSVKRVVSADAQSDYFINNVRCRRRDIKDLFLGTGLGPRSYAIIMQDTISRLIEAKPEELRSYLEEAAGISKYKERRKETEARITQTRENLDRLTDLRDEFGNQLERLKRQANAAEKYKSLREEERGYKAQLQVLNWQNLEEKAEHLSFETRKAENKVEEATAELRSLEAENERMLDQHTTASESYNEVQARFYQIGAQISTIENNKQHLEQRLQEQQAMFDDLVARSLLLNEQSQQDSQKIEGLTTTLAQLAPRVSESQQHEKSLRERLSQLEKEADEWQQQWDSFNREAANTLQQAEVLKTKIQHLEEAVLSSSRRHEKLQEEKSAIDTSALESTISELDDQFNHASQAIQKAQTENDQLITEIRAKKTELDTVNQALNENQKRQHQWQGRFASLEALQQEALGQSDSQQTGWLNEHGFKMHQRLGQTLHVESGYERAVEYCLGDYLEAVCVDDLTQMDLSLENIKDGRLCFVSTKAKANSEQKSGLTALSSKLTKPSAATTLLDNIFIVESLRDALAQTANLAPHQSIITKSGVWLGANWIRVNKEQDNKSGVIARQQEIDNLKVELEQLQNTINEAERTRDEVRHVLEEMEKQREQTQSALQAANQRHADSRAKLQVKQAELKRAETRANELADELLSLEDERYQFQQDIKATRDRWQSALQQAEQDAKQRESLSEKSSAARSELQNFREQLHQAKDKAHQLQLEERTTSMQLESLRQGLQRIDAQAQELLQRKQQLEVQLQNADAPIAEMIKTLDEAFSKRSSVEKELTVAKEAAESLEQGMREVTRKRQVTEGHLNVARSEADKFRLELQALATRRLTIEETLQESQLDIETVRQSMPENASINGWEQHLETLKSRIERLGPINLAAIDEYAQLDERKMYLDAQNSDLVSALDTLENAIRKIDKETRQRFKETYETVNNHFQTLFPKIFGGGSASLELTGDDLLETGVSVMARPPGKRNSTIHLLSGGEKALTALSLVFSLFQLNPAPFCLLDEVDAPLDDANITRFCNLVKEMSKTVQFLFISHNKLAIEMADQLVGVSMHEPGVSRLVAVDIEQAVAMAEA